jgi:mannose-1-phosphate guanylyltransferase
VVLAAGVGRRLSALTMTPGGVAIPKQFCSLWGGRSLLEDALQRVRRVAARERTCTVVAAAHRAWWEPLAWSLPMRNTIVQPQDRGTAIGVLLALLHVEQRDARAYVVLAPADHDVRDEPVLAAALQQATRYAATHPHLVTLLGLRPDEPDTELGYIVPSGQLVDGAAAVGEFIEKPAAEDIADLMQRGALWNGFLVCAHVRALLGLYERDHAATVAALRVVPVRDCGWSDLGCVRSVTRVVGRGRHGPLRASGPVQMPVLSQASQGAAA